jgi:hypothetical protein
MDRSEPEGHHMIYPQMPIVGPPPPTLTAAAARRWFIGHPKRTLPTRTVGTIIDTYVDACTIAEVPFGLAAAMCELETDGLSSGWSQPPRRNVAGIGVNGTTNPDGTPAGQWFATYQLSALVHVGLIVCYFFDADDPAMTDSQRQLADVAVHVRPRVPRGGVATVEELGARWAADPEYVSKLGERHRRMAAA